MLSNQEWILAFTAIYMMKIVLHMFALYSKIYEWEKHIELFGGLVNRGIVIFSIKLFKSCILFFVFKLNNRPLARTINIMVLVAYLIFVRIIFMG
jgi:hypothetical protein